MKDVLILFDVDGTLCDTGAVDAECFAIACAEALALSAGELDWSTAPHVTDAGIVQWLWRRKWGRAPSLEEISSVRERFLALLAMEQSRSPRRFQGMPGARAALDRLRAQGVPAAAASGAWADSARLKLAAAGFAPAILLASSDDSAERVEVFRLAAERAEAGRRRVERVVLVGDGLCDVEVARRLGWAFIGVGTEALEQGLRRAGARAILPDFRDPGAFERLVAEALQCNPTQ